MAEHLSTSMNIKLQASDANNYFETFNVETDFSEYIIDPILFNMIIFHD